MKKSSDLSTFRLGLKNWALWLDLGLAFLLFFLAMGFAQSEYNRYRKDWTKKTFYEHYLSNAVLVACGRDSGRPSTDIPPIPELEDFLQLRVETFSCDDLPRDLQTRPPRSGQRLTHEILHKYLHYTVALIWSIRGISWSALDPLFGFFCGLVTVLSYALFRLGMGRLLAITGTVLFFTVHLVQLPYFRDYARAPFFLGTILLLGLMIRKPLRPAVLFGLSALTGVLIGIGQGFRADLQMCVPAVLLVLGFLPQISKTSLQTSLKAGAVFLICLTLSYSPILVGRLSHPTSDTAAAHILQGFDNRFTEELGIQNALYEWSPVYSDAWPNFQTRIQAFLGQGYSAPVTLYSPDFNKFGMQLVRDIFLTFPADILIRTYASVLKIIKLPVVFGLVIALLGLYRPRLAICLFFLVVYFSGYPFLQFARRHFFHLEYMSLWIVGFAIHMVASQVWYFFSHWQPARLRREQQQSLPQWLISRRYRFLLVPVLLCLLIFPLYGLRWYQHWYLGSFFSSYFQAQIEPLTFTKTRLDEERMLLEGFSSDQLLRLPSESHRELLVGYLALEFSQEQCAEETFSVILRYEDTAYHNFSRSVDVSLVPHEVTRVYSPIYSRPKAFFGNALFQGIELPRRAIPCLKGGYRIRNLEKFPPFLQLNLPGDWERLPRYQRLKERDGWREFLEIFSVTSSFFL